jgi:predicted lipoprotein with Yx(FWY)xxD motif
MTRTLQFLLAALAASLSVAACGGSGSTSSSSAPAPASATSVAGAQGAAVVKTASNAALGETVLVDSSGMTLYSLSGEGNGRFICTSSACLTAWHPLRTSAATVSGSVPSLGTVKRPDGTEQVTYKGMPLYTFAADRSAGEAKGQGLKDVGTWSAVTVGSGTSGGTSGAGTSTAAGKYSY